MLVLSLVREEPRPDEVRVRMSTEDRTMQVAGAMRGVMGAGSWPWAVHTQPRPCVPSFSSLLRCARAERCYTRRSILVPAFACPVADVVRNAFEEVPVWAEHLPVSENAPLEARLDAVFGTEGLDAWASWCM